MPLAEQREAASLAQRHIVESQDAVYVEACPGAGKTRVLIERAINLIAELPPRHGLAILTFSNAAVKEIEKRFGLKHPLFPSFIGTFDSFLWRFLISPFGLQEGIAPKLVPDIGDQMISPTMGNTSGTKMREFPLRLFDQDTGQIRANLVGADRRLAEGVRPAKKYQTLAAAVWRRRREAGFLGYQDARSLAQDRINDAEFRPILDALAARFEELIVDESQDCNPSDLSIIQSLRECGLPVSVIGDPDQAIYGFRHGSAPALRDFAAGYEAHQRHVLNGNFRSSRAVCGIASLFRAPFAGYEIVALSDPFVEADSAYLLTYRPRNNTVPDTIGSAFTNILNAAEIAPTDAPMVAHRENYARRAVGLCPIDRSQSSFVVRLANSVAAYNAAGGHWRTKAKAIEQVCALIFEYWEVIEAGESFHQALVRVESDVSDFRAEVLELITTISPKSGDSDDPRGWLDRVKKSFDLRFFDGRKRLLMMPRQRTLGNLKHALTIRDVNDFPISTIHNVKGQEFPAICVVIPPRGAVELIARLEQGQIEESERVLYVGLTRAKQVAALAVPEVIRDRVLGLASRNCFGLTVIDC